MAFHERHRQQRRKNYILLLVLVGLIAVTYGITLVKFG